MKKFIVLSVMVLSLNIFCKDAAWYKCFKGKIGEYPATVHLCKQDKQISGYYYYDKYIMPLVIFGGFVGDSLNLIAYTNSYSSEFFYGVLKNGVYAGQWDREGKDGKLNFRFEEDTKLSAMFKYEFVSGGRKLIRNYDKSPTADYLEGSIWPTEKYPNYLFMRRAICGEKNFSTRLTDLKPVMESNMSKYFESYFKENESLTKKEIEDIGWTSSYNIADEDYISIVYYDKNLFVTGRYNYAYAGGVHGNYATSYSVYDINTSKKLTIGDVITTEGMKMFPALLEKNYRIQNNVSDTLKLSEELFVDTIYVTENFAITPGCLMFSYPPYDIASYAAGEIKIYIPINEAEKYLKPAALKLIR